MLASHFCKALLTFLPGYATSPTSSFYKYGNWGSKIMESLFKAPDGIH